jgi:hypothetical protein
LEQGGKQHPPPSEAKIVSAPWKFLYPYAMKNPEWNIFLLMEEAEKIRRKNCRDTIFAARFQSFSEKN